MIRRLVSVALLLAAVAAGLAYLLSRPGPLDPGEFAMLQGDGQRGETVFWAAGCASCHAAPGAQGDDRLVLSGGRRFGTDFGVFSAPNISPDPEHGIGTWSLEDMARALRLGVAPDGRNYYPAFPYTAYVRMTAQDIADLWAFLKALPASTRPNEDHDLAFPFTIRRGVGLWNRLYLTDAWAVEGALSEVERRGRYLSEALAHCGECHTPRDRFGGMDRNRWLAGAPNPSGSGRIPNITPSVLRWTEAEIAGYLDLGFTPSFDTAGGTMAEVVKNLHRLTPEDRQAIAAYLKRVAPAE